MDIDEKRLRELVIKAIELIKLESMKNIFIAKKKLYVMLTEEWNSKYWSFFEKLDKQNEYEVYAVVPSRLNTTFHINNLKKFEVCRGIVNEKDVCFDDLLEYTTVFPTVSRNIIAKTALCIDDIFETKWIFKSMEKGQKIVFLKSGLQKFSGKEPINYRKKILDYYRTLLEFDIEITEFIMNDEKHALPDGCKDNLLINYNTNNHIDWNESELRYQKKVITEKELESYIKDNIIILNNGDIITDMARDKARSLNISIIKR